MNLYFYNGPLFKFGTVYMPNWKGYTHASSEKKALTNLTHQFKQAYGFMPSAKITLPGKIELIEGKEETDYGKL